MAPEEIDKYTGFTIEDIIEIGRRNRSDEINLWTDIAVAYTGASNVTKKEGAVEWANYITDEYIKRYKQ